MYYNKNNNNNNNRPIVKLSVSKSQVETPPMTETKNGYYEYKDDSLPGHCGDHS